MKGTSGVFLVVFKWNFIYSLKHLHYLHFQCHNYIYTYNILATYTIYTYIAYTIFFSFFTYTSYTYTTHTIFIFNFKKLLLGFFNIIMD